MVSTRGSTVKSIIPTFYVPDHQLGLQTRPQSITLDIYIDNIL